MIPTGREMIHLSEMISSPERKEWRVIWTLDSRLNFLSIVLDRKLSLRQKLGNGVESRRKRVDWMFYFLSYHGSKGLSKLDSK